MFGSFKWKHRHTSLLIVFSIWIVSYIDRMVMSVALPYIADEFTLNGTESGFLLSIFYLGYSFCQIPGGILSDKFGARKLLVVAIILWTIFTVITGLVFSFALLILVRLLFGACEGMASAATWKALAVWTPIKKRSFSNSLMLSSTAFGPAITPMLVIAVMGSWGWRPVFFVLLIPGLLLALWVWFKLPDQAKDKKGISGEELEELVDIQLSKPLTKQLSKGAALINVDGQGEALKVQDLSFWQICQIPTVWMNFCLMFFFILATSGFIMWYPSYLVGARALDFELVGILSTLPFLGGTVGILSAGWLAENNFKQKPQYLFVFYQLGFALSLYLMLSVESLNHMIFWSILVGFFTYSGTGVAFGMPISAVPSSIAGRAMGLINTAGQAAGFLSPLIVGFLIQVDGQVSDYSTAFSFLCASAVVAAILGLFYKVKQA